MTKYFFSIWYFYVLIQPAINYDHRECKNQSETSIHKIGREYAYIISWPCYICQCINNTRRKCIEYQTCEEINCRKPTGLRKDCCILLRCAERKKLFSKNTNYDVDFDDEFESTINPNVTSSKHTIAVYLVVVLILFVIILFCIYRQYNYDGKDRNMFWNKRPRVKYVRVSRKNV